jgi:hypothetical protein
MGEDVHESLSGVPVEIFLMLKSVILLQERVVSDRVL